MFQARLGQTFTEQKRESQRIDEEKILTHLVTHAPIPMIISLTQIQTWTLCLCSRIYFFFLSRSNERAPASYSHELPINQPTNSPRIIFYERLLRDDSFLIIRRKLAIEAAENSVPSTEERIDNTDTDIFTTDHLVIQYANSRLPRSPKVNKLSGFAFVRSLINRSETGSFKFQMTATR